MLCGLSSGSVNLGMCVVKDLRSQGKKCPQEAVL